MAVETTAGELRAFRQAIGRLARGAPDRAELRRTRLWQGVYADRRPGLVMVRVKLPQGNVTPAQLYTVARLAETYAGGVVHLTTRQDVQLHGVPLARAPRVLTELALSGLTTREACGNSVRNVTACPLSGACPKERANAAEVGAAITRRFLRHPLVQDLPRKFKVAVSGCPYDCAWAAIHDVGLVAEGDGIWRVLVGGGLGPRPMPARELGRYPTGSLLRLIEAILRVFDARGTRDDPRRTRMKFLVRDVGIDAFRGWVEEESASGPDLVEPPLEARAGVRPIVLACSEGQIPAAALRAVAEAAAECGGSVRVTSDQNLLLLGVPAEALGVLPAVSEVRMRVLGPSADPRSIARTSDVVACPGTRTCNLALTASVEAGRAIGEALRAGGLEDVAGVRVHVSGCSNSCSRCWVAGVGLQGVVRRVGGHAVPTYRVFVGGRAGEGEAAFGAPAGDVPTRRVTDAVLRIVRWARSRAEPLVPADASEVRALLGDLCTIGDAEQEDLTQDLGQAAEYVPVRGQGECAPA